MVKKLFIEAFDKVRLDTRAISKNAIAKNLSNELDKPKPKGSGEKNLSRYYEKYVEEREVFIEPNGELLDALSSYLGYGNYSDFVKHHVEVAPIPSFRDSYLFNDTILFTIYTVFKEDYKSFPFRIRKLIQKLYPHLNEGENPIHFISPTLDKESIEFAFIIIAFSSPHLNFSIKKKIEAIISQLGRIKKQIETLQIITNLVLKEKELEEVKQLFDAVLKKNKSIGSIEFYDVEAFITTTIYNFDSEQMDVFIRKNDFYKKQVQAIMESEIYLEEVPYELLGATKTSTVKETSPSAFIKNELFSTLSTSEAFAGAFKKHKEIEVVVSRPINWNIVVSEFGYGKTSLLLHLTALLDRQYEIVYLPLAQMNADCFKSQEHFIVQLFEILFERKYRLTETLDAFNYYCLKENLLNKKSMILIFDGLDEHITSYSLKGLQSIFNCIHHLEADCIFSVRKEFWDDRKGDFETIFRKSQKYNTAIQLTEWSEALITNYVNHYQKKYFPKGNKHLDAFKEKVAANKFDTLYGDIPKRPLFLNMIIKDVLRGNIERKSLRDLYQSYLIEKFTRDREGVFKDNKTGRQLRMEATHDRYEIIQALWSVLKAVAGKMIHIKNGALLLTSSIPEKEVSAIISELQYPINIRELLLHTVLIPINYRTLEEGLELFFAHRSFQEYYMALYLDDEKSILNSKADVSKGVLCFLK